MAIEQKTTHEAEVEDLQLEQFKDATNMAALIGVYVAEVQNIENNIFDVRSAYWLDYAIGTQLDAIGDIVGIDRKGLNDAPYRNAIRMQIACNNSDGTTDDLLALFELYGATPTYRDWYDATIVFTGLTATNDAAYLSDFLQQARSAGVNLQLVYNAVVAPASAFRFGTAVTPVTGATYTGFAAVTGTNGGHLLGVY